MQTGVTANTGNNIIFDAGAVYLGSVSPATLLGATVGGSTFNLETEIRTIEVDGAKGPVKGLRRVTSRKPVLTVKMLELTAERFRNAIAGAVKASDTGGTKLTGGDITSNDYLPAVILVATYSGSANPVIFTLTNALCDAGMSLDLAPKTEPVPSIVFTGHYDPTDLTIEPWSIVHPDAFAGVPAIPAMTTPTNGATAQSKTATSLLWGAVTGCDYVYQCSKDAAFSTPLMQQAGRIPNGTVTILLGTLLGLTTYYWRVAAVRNTDGVISPWSATYNFTTAA